MKNINNKEYVKNILFTIIIAVLFSILYGVVHLNFMYDIRGQIKTIRFKGSYEPNFTAWYVNIAIISLYFLKKEISEKYNKNIYYFLQGLLILTLIFTWSISGFIAFGVLFIIYVVKNRKIKLGIIIAAIATVILGYLFIKVHNNQFDNIGRIGLIINKIEKKDFNSLTSGRLAIAEDFIKESFNRPLINILFGNGPDSKLVYSKYFKMSKYSHNTYIDLMYNFGIMGFIISFCYIINKIKKEEILGISIQNYKAIQLIRMISLLFGLTLPLYNEALFLLFFI